MKNERLYIDGELVDIDGGTQITMSIKSNLFRDVSKIVSNSTYTVKLPKTVRNQKILLHVDLVQNTSIYAYRLHKARYFRNGVELIKDGRVSVLQVTEEAIEVSIVWGLFSQFSSLISKGTALNDLKSNDKILYNLANEVNRFEDVKEKPYFYAGYNVWKYDDEEDMTWRTDSSMISPGNNSERQKKTWFEYAMRFKGEYSPDKKGVPYLHPVVRVPFVLSLIKSQTGIDFQFHEEAKEYINTLVLPLINRKSNDLTSEGAFGATFEPMAMQSGQMSLNVTDESSVLSGQRGNKVTSIAVTTDATLIFDIKAEWSFELGGKVKPVGRSGGIGGDTDRFNFQKGCLLRMTITKGAEHETYDMGTEREPFSFTVPRGYRGVCRFTNSGYGKIEVVKGSTITFEWIDVTHFPNMQVIGGTIKATLSKGENVPDGGYFPIAYNLPKIKVIDFVKFLTAITGSFPLQITEDGIVRLVPLSTIWKRRDEAVDWTNKIIAPTSENKPSELNYKVEDYGQHNRYKWKEDDTVKGHYDGDLRIDNETLDIEKVMYEFPFAATDGDTVPMYKIEKAKKSGNGSAFTGNRGEDKDEITKTKEPPYSACKDRILRLRKDSNGLAVAYFDIYMQDILDEKYRDMIRTLQQPKVIKEKVKMRDLEILRFDETRPIYLAQYGAYFAATEIRATNSDMAEVTMLQLTFE